MIGVCFFFKQKTAYEMRIRDWSSDVCSSDLLEPQMLAERVRDDENVGKEDRAVETEAPDRLQGHFGRRLGIVAQLEEPALGLAQRTIFGQIASGQIGRASCRERVCQYV